MRMPFGRYRGQPVADCPRDYLTWLLSSGPRLSRTLRDAVEDALVPDRISCVGPRWWYLQQQRDVGGLWGRERPPGPAEGPAERRD
jgi:hypothetical protein